MISGLRSGALARVSSPRSRPIAYAACSSSVFNGCPAGAGSLPVDSWPRTIDKASAETANKLQAAENARHVIEVVLWSHYRRRKRRLRSRKEGISHRGTEAQRHGENK